MKYEIYTDGACRGNGKKNPVGGWGYIILKDGEIIHQANGGELNTTNQRMELIAAIMACEKIEEMDSFANVKVYSDSAYMVNCKKQNWYKSWERNGWKNSKKEPVANPDLWKRLIRFFDNEMQFEFIKVKGHAGNKYNEVVDDLAVAGAEAMRNERQTN